MNKKENPRLKNLVIRVTEKEQHDINRKALNLGLSISDYGRQLMLKGAVLSVQKNETETEAPSTGIDRRTIIGIANNLNQLTRYANQTKQLPDIEKVLKQVEKIISKW